MPIWSEILSELGESCTRNKGTPDFDGVRRKYLTGLYQYTGRNAILYASGWLQKQSSPSTGISINDEDVQAFMEVSQGLEGTDLDLILHSPGGSPEAAEAIVSYLRSRFSHIRVIVPHLAMSAATMISCAADEIVLGKHSFLGPTDPQILLSTKLGTRLVSAQAVLDQFDKAQRECAKNPEKLLAWSPMLSQYGPDLLEHCENALDMSRELVKTWLGEHMFRKMDDGPKKAERISGWLADHQNFKSHARHIPRGELEEKKLRIMRLEADEELQDISLSVYHATTHTFSGTSSIKIVENHNGRAFIKHQAATQLPQGKPH